MMLVQKLLQFKKGQLYMDRCINRKYIFSEMVSSNAREEWLVKL